MDDDLLQVAREAIGAHFGLSAQLSARLRGSTRSELESDARAMRRELGLPELDERGEHRRDKRGRFRATTNRELNEAVRKVAGRRA
jgi:hypothetical protein